MMMTKFGTTINYAHFQYFCLPLESFKRISVAGPNMYIQLKKSVRFETLATVNMKVTVYDDAV
jgi:hypothetical protein